MDLTKIEEAANRVAEHGAGGPCWCGDCAKDRAFLAAQARPFLVEVERLQQVDRDATAMLDDAAEKIGRLMLEVERLEKDLAAHREYISIRDGHDPTIASDGKVRP